MNTLLFSAGVLVFALTIVGCTAFLLSKQRKLKKYRADRVTLVASAPRHDHILADRSSPVPHLHSVKPPGRSLTIDEQIRYLDSWRFVQAKFVDDPGRAVTEADRLMAEIIAARGYLADGIGYRVSEISAQDRDAVEQYRLGHEIAVQQLRGRATIDDLRQAIIHYRTSIDAMLGHAEALWPAEVI